MRLIDANALIEWLKSPIGFRTNCEDCTEIDCLDCIIEEAIKNAPTIDAEPVRHGTWEDVNSAYWRWYPEGARVVNRVTYRCSRCGRGAITKTDYCTCGAKMDGGVSDER